MKRRKYTFSFIVSFGVFMCFLAVTIYYVRPVRNVLLQPVWPHSWRSITTSDILAMRGANYNVYNVTDLLDCPIITSPAIRLNDVPKHSNLLSYPKATEENEFFKDKLYVGFLPGVSQTDRFEVLWMYIVLAEALKRAKVPFFFINGSLLGVFRHGGAIPWDTDIDLAVNVTDWEIIRQTVSCIKGFRLKTKPFMHWKFSFADRLFPFIDLFFYTENNDYLWSLTDYEFKSLVYKKEDVLPLTTAIYEGVQVPVPAHTDRIVRQEFDIEYCYPQDKNYKTGARHKQSYVLCSSLTSVYPIQNLKF